MGIVKQLCEAVAGQCQVVVAAWSGFSLFRRLPFSFP